MSKTTSDRAWAVLAAWVEGLGLSPENRKRGYQRIHDYADARAALKGDAEMDAGPLSRTDPIRCLVERLEARVAELEAALRGCEWQAGDDPRDGLRCPLCCRWKGQGGHAPDCPLVKALKGDTHDA